MTEISRMIQQLPNELLLAILTMVPDLDTLRILILAYPQAKLLYQTFYKEILLAVIKRSIPTLQIQKLICTVLCVRSKRPSASDKEIHEFIDTHLENEQAAPMIAHLPDPIAILQSMVQTTRDVNHFEKSFVLTLLHALGPNWNEKIWRTETVPTVTALHRIRRAFWRFQLDCDQFHHPDLFLSLDLAAIATESPANEGEEEDRGTTGYFSRLLAE